MWWCFVFRIKFCRNFEEKKNKFHCWWHFVRTPVTTYHNLCPCRCGLQTVPCCKTVDWEAATICASFALVRENEVLTQISRRQVRTERDVCSQYVKAGGMPRRQIVHQLERQRLQRHLGDALTDFGQQVQMTQKPASSDRTSSFPGRV